jgi:hypothetical protein
LDLWLVIDSRLINPYLGFLKSAQTDFHSFGCLLLAVFVHWQPTEIEPMAACHSELLYSGCISHSQRREDKTAGV